MDVRVGLWRRLSAEEFHAFELWCWIRLLTVPWTARRSNQSILKEISPGISLEGMMLKLKLQYLATSCEELTHWKRLWCCDGLGAGGEGDDRGWDGWMASRTRWTWVWVNSGRWWWTGRPGLLRFLGSQRVGHDWATELYWTTMKVEPSWMVLMPWVRWPFTSCLSTCGNTKSQQSGTLKAKECSHQNSTVLAPWFWTSHSPKPWKKKMFLLFLSLSTYGIFCYMYGILKGLRLYCALMKRYCTLKVEILFISPPF